MNESISFFYYYSHENTDVIWNLKECFVFFQAAEPENLFVNYLSRIHREEVPQSLAFIIEKDDAGGY